MPAKSEGLGSHAMWAEYLPTLIPWSCIVEIELRQTGRWLDRRVRSWEKSKNWDGDIKNRYRQGTKKWRFGREDYDFIFRWVVGLFPITKKQKPQNQKRIHLTLQEMWDFDKNTCVQWISKENCLISPHTRTLQWDHSNSSYCILVSFWEENPLFFA